MKIVNILHTTIVLLWLQQSTAIKGLPWGNCFFGNAPKAGKKVPDTDIALKGDAFKWPTFKIPAFVQDSLKSPLAKSLMVATILFKPVLSPAINNLRVLIRQYLEELEEEK